MWGDSSGHVLAGSLLSSWTLMGSQWSGPVRALTPHLAPGTSEAPE